MTRHGDTKVKNLVMEKRVEESIFNSECDGIELFQKKSLTDMFLG